MLYGFIGVKTGVFLLPMVFIPGNGFLHFFCVNPDRRAAVKQISPGKYRSFPCTVQTVFLHRAVYRLAASQTGGLFDVDEPTPAGFVGKALLKSKYSVTDGAAGRIE